MARGSGRQSCEQAAHPAAPRLRVLNEQILGPEVRGHERYRNERSD
jgi:hypothetical protein